MMLTSRTSQLSELTRVNDDLKTQFDLELMRLKEREKQLQDALKLKTRLDLLNSMEKELAIDNLDDGGLSRSRTRSNLNNSVLFNNTSGTGKLTNSIGLSTLSTADDLVQLSDESLIKSGQVMSKLTNDLSRTQVDFDCAICGSGHDHDHGHEKRSSPVPIDTSEFLRSSVYKTVTTPKTYAVNYTTTGPIRPNVVFGKSNKLPRPSSSGVRASLLDLNKQQTFVYEEEKPRAKSGLGQMSRSASEKSLNNRIFRTSMSNKPFYLHQTMGTKSATAKYATSYPTTSNSLNDYGSYTRLPLTKTLIHNKPWSYGKVECIYYPYRDSKLHKK